MAASRVIVCGGRHADDWNWFRSKMDSLFPDKHDLTIIHGCATGVDQMAARYAVTHGLTEIRFPAQWSKFGPSAGPRRNQQMLDEGKPDMVVAFPGGRGTDNMVRKARAAGVIVHTIDALV